MGPFLLSRPMFSERDSLLVVCEHSREHVPVRRNTRQLAARFLEYSDVGQAPAVTEPRKKISSIIWIHSLLRNDLHLWILSLPLLLQKVQ